jgi:conjugal transfer pilus assembly protein TraW
MVTRAILLLALLWFTSSHAKALGVIGTPFLIAEPDLLVVIQNQVAMLSRHNGFDALQADVNRSLGQALDQPAAVIGLSRALKSRTWLFDPSIILSDDVKDDHGQVVLSAGQKMNPLDKASLQHALVFYDASDSRQVRLAEQLNKLLQGNTELILVGGSVKSQMERFHKPVYFDQGSRLIGRFQLHHVPSVITQEDRHLRIQEVALP